MVMDGDQQYSVDSFAQVEVMRRKTAKLMGEASLTNLDYMDQHFDSFNDCGLMDRVDSNANLNDSYV